MVRIILHILIVAAALLAITSLNIGVTVSSIPTALLVAVLWGVINWTLKPILNLLALPINLLTLGLFSFVINALLFWLLAALVPGFSVAGFIPALEGSVLLLIVSWVLHAVGL